MKRKYEKIEIKPLDVEPEHIIAASAPVHPVTANETTLEAVTFDDGKDFGTVTFE